MTDEEIMKGIIVKTIGADADTITEASRIVQDLGGDSLDRMELVMEIEEAFGIAVPDHEVDQLETFGDYMALIDGR